jgi:hypothetical protein
MDLLGLYKGTKGDSFMHLEEKNRFYKTWRRQNFFLEVGDLYLISFYFFDFFIQHASILYPLCPGTAFCPVPPRTFSLAAL